MKNTYQYIELKSGSLKIPEWVAAFLQEIEKIKGSALTELEIGSSILYLIGFVDSSKIEPFAKMTWEDIKSLWNLD